MVLSRLCSSKFIRASMVDRRRCAIKVGARRTMPGGSAPVAYRHCPKARRPSQIETDSRLRCSSAVQLGSGTFSERSCPAPDEAWSGA